ncbi:MAG: flagellar basal-body rod protein FlgF [Bauldia sp.]
MDNAQLIGLSRQLSLQRELDIVANNLANVNTGGFRAGKLRFEEYIMPVAAALTLPPGNQTLSYVRDGASMTDFTQGTIELTGHPFDIALNGSGWFAIQTKNGERYTRNGAFTLDAQGTLVTGIGDQVMTESGPVTFAPGETDVSIAPDGTISSSAGSKGKLKIVAFKDETTLLREGESLFSGTGAQPAENVRVVGGAIEKSNVRAVTEITRMIEVTRAYQQIAKIMQDRDQLQQSAIATLGQLKN